MTSKTHEQGHSAHPHEQPHPKTRQYVVIAVTLTIITMVEVAIFYIEPIKASPIFVPLLLLLSAVKFALVVMFYMHLRFDPRMFSALFVAPLMIAVGIVMALLFLFGHFVV